MKTLIVSDPHFGEFSHGFVDAESGLNSRLLDIQKVFENVINYAIENGIDNIIIEGDIYDIKNPGNFIRSMFVSLVSKIIEADIKLYIITGNHDQRSSFIISNSLSELKAISSNLIPTLKVIDKMALKIFYFACFSEFVPK
jgi:exonuclease SbcD